MSIGNEFQADGAETAKALSVNRRRVRGVLKSPLDLERSRLSVHGPTIYVTPVIHVWLGGVALGRLTCDQ